MNSDLFDALCQVKGLTVKKDEPLSSHTTFRIGGPATMVFPETEDQLREILWLCSCKGETPVILGKGSNVLAPDEGLSSLVICLKNMQEIIVKENTITAGAGATLAKLASAAQLHGLTGLEFAHGIPGSLGGGTVMNAGAYGGELKDVVTEARCLDLQGNWVVKAGEQLDFRYRHSCFDGGGLVITSVTLALRPGDPAEIRARMDELAAKRRASQPLEYPSAGSTFKRPAGHFAAALIQECGLKGLTVGGAQVSEKHSGFVINQGGATRADVLALTNRIKEEVLRQTGVELELEVKLL